MSLCRANEEIKGESACEEMGHSLWRFDPFLLRVSLGIGKLYLLFFRDAIFPFSTQALGLFDPTENVPIHHLWSSRIYEKA